MPPQTPQNLTPSNTQKESAGPIVGAIIVILLLMVGGLYFWFTRASQQSQQDKLPFITGDTSTSINQ